MADLAHSLREHLSEYGQYSVLAKALNALLDVHSAVKTRLDCGHSINGRSPGHLAGTHGTTEDEDGNWWCANGDTNVCRACCVGEDGDHITTTCAETHDRELHPCWPCCTLSVISEHLGVEAGPQ